MKSLYSISLEPFYYMAVAINLGSFSKTYIIQTGSIVDTEGSEK